MINLFILIYHLAVSPSFMVRFVITLLIFGRPQVFPAANICHINPSYSFLGMISFQINNIHKTGDLGIQEKEDFFL